MIPPFVEALKNKQCYTHPTHRIVLVETHISWVFLTGQYAYKIKKPVLHPFVDFSTLEKRRWFCEEEVRINRRLAPQLYLHVIPITGSPSNPQMDGEGTPFEFAVKMRQFPSDQEFHELLAAGKINEHIMNQLATLMGGFHSRIDSAEETSPFGTPNMVKQAVEECFEEIPLDALPRPLQQSVEEIKLWITREWKRLEPLLVERKSSGHIRECHGDLHLGNIALLGSEICIFDALEFSPNLRWIDVISEIAFLVMDLKSRDRSDLAYTVLNRYLEVTGDYSGMGVFRLYEVYRALVRAKVAGLRLAQVSKESAERSTHHQELIRYVELANQLIKVSPPQLILMHGLSGGGKTTVSTEVLKNLGAVRIRSDVERKRIEAEKSGVQNQEARGDLYSSGMTQATYKRLLDLTEAILQGGYSVVVDAAFLQISQRKPFIRFANEHQIALYILDVWAPEEVLVRRIESRSKDRTDASDATVDIMYLQKKRQEAFSDSECSRTMRIDTRDVSSLQTGLQLFFLRIKGEDNPTDHKNMKTK